MRDYSGKFFVEIKGANGVRSSPRYPPRLWSTYVRLLLQLALMTNARERQNGIINRNQLHTKPELPKWSGTIKNIDRLGHEAAQVRSVGCEQGFRARKLRMCRNLRLILPSFRSTGLERSQVSGFEARVSEVWGAKPRKVQKFGREALPSSRS